jgi:hypothetical protein
MPETVESAIPSSSAICGPVNRSRRNAAIASTRRAQVRLATVLGAEERSLSPAAPSPANRLTHLRTVGSET